MTDLTPDQTDPFGNEYHDCGEVYPPGTDTTPRLEQGPYVGVIAARLLPSFGMPPES